MGTYRFFLAIAVALSHMGVTFRGGHNPGTVAVISFFLISGFVMTGLVRSHYSEYRKIPMYYLDRLARIFPQYLFFLVLAAASYFLFNISSTYLSDVSFAGAVANVLVVPLDFYMYSPAIAGCTFSPQAWSLGLELTFYLLFPVILIGGRRDLWFVASLLVWFFAAYGVIDTDHWGYRLLPGTLFIFLLGSYIYDFRQPSPRHPAVLLFILMMVSAVAFRASGKLDLPYSYEVLAGLFVGVPALFFLARCNRNGWDDWLGNLSYGIFLCHFLVIWIADLLGVTRDMGGKVLMITAAVALAYLGYIAIERPVVRWRRGLRRGKARV
ncbi:MAG: acyltransferase [Betaproteobacteria bacterium]|nr:acyltransferase [Betaproteobacteria bacterium]